MKTAADSRLFVHKLFETFGSSTRCFLEDDPSSLPDLYVKENQQEKEWIISGIISLVLSNLLFLHTYILVFCVL